MYVCMYVCMNECVCVCVCVCDWTMNKTQGLICLKNNQLNCLLEIESKKKLIFNFSSWQLSLKINVNLSLVTPRVKHRSIRCDKCLHFCHIFLCEVTGWQEQSYYFMVSSVGWGCSIHRQHLCGGVIPSNECPDYEIKPFDGETSALEIWEMWSTPSLSLLSGPH